MKQIHTDKICENPPNPCHLRSKPVKGEKNIKLRRFIFQLNRFVVHRFTSYSKKGHGIHSPFVFNLVTNVFNVRDADHSLKEVQLWHRALYKNRQLIDPGAYGAGSVTGNSGQKTIREIAIKSSIKPGYGKLLFRLVKHFGINSALELGTGLGISTAYILNASPSINFTSIEGSREKFLFAVKEFQSKEWVSVHFINAEFDNFLKNFEIVSHPFLAFIDGNHRYEPTIKYFHQIADQCRDNSLLIFDDIHWSREMEMAWDEICRDERVSLSIDLFSMGLIFFRKGMGKLHYKIEHG